MSTIIDLIYREYCRARLAEMRKQLLLSVSNDEIPAPMWDGGRPIGPDGQGRDAATRKPGDPVAGSCNRIDSVGEPARYPHMSRASRVKGKAFRARD
jgi:hypothetical protein